MSLKLKYLKLASLGALLFGLLPAASYAATCVVNTPDPDSMITGASNTTDCGIGDDSQPSDAALDSLITPGSWSEISKVDSGVGGTSGQLSYTGETLDGPGGAATSGDWGFDFAGNSYTHLALILKDGDLVGDAKWVWYLVDLAGSCPNGTSGLPAASDICGEWYMYGNGTNRKAISFMSIWGIEGGRVPEPASLLLIGLGFAGLALVQRRRRKA